MHKKRFGIRRFLEPLVILPYAFFGIYLYEHGFDWFVVILAIILFIMIPGFLVVLWDKL